MLDAIKPKRKIEEIHTKNCFILLANNGRYKPAKALLIMLQKDA
jgi:hypothetical protein